MPVDQNILEAIPHREPFLWVDKIISRGDDFIIAEKYIDPNLDFFRGHYPGQPILPGVFLCEAVFQTGALLSSEPKKTIESKSMSKFPVITKISEARFKRMVFPGNTLKIEVKLKEIISSVHFYKGTVRVDDKIALKIDFTATFLESSSMEAS